MVYLSSILDLIISCLVLVDILDPFLLSFEYIFCFTFTIDYHLDTKSWKMEIFEVSRSVAHFPDHVSAVQMMPLTIGPEDQLPPYETLHLTPRLLNLLLPGLILQSPKCFHLQHWIPASSRLLNKSIFISSLCLSPYLFSSFLWKLLTSLLKL